MNARMKLSAFRLLVLLAIIGCATRSSAQSTSPEAIADDYVKAWNSHDMKAFDRLFAEDARFIRFADSQSAGRPDIIKEFSAIHTTWAKDISIYHQAPKVRSLCRDSTVVTFDLGHLDEHGKEAPGIDIAMLVVAVRQQDGWRIVVGQITHPSHPPGP
jgi:uncharacterized protein (TIGR02246 family)